VTFTTASGGDRPSITHWMLRGAGFATGVAVVVGLIALAISAAGVLVLVFLSIVLASGLEPVVGGVRSRIGIGRGLTILLVYGAFFLAVIGLALLVVPDAVSEFEGTIDRLPPFFDAGHAWAADLRPLVLSRAVMALVDAGSRVVAQGGTPTPTTGQVVQVGLTVAEAVVSLATMLTIVYFWLTEHARLQRYVLAFLPAPRRTRARDVWNEVETRLGHWVRGQLSLMAAMGVATTIAWTVLGVPGAQLLGLIAGITEVIPIVGPFLGAVPAVIVAATVSPQLALVVAGVYVVLQFVEGNVLVPIVMRNSIGISPLLVIVSLLVGAAVAGLIGALVAVPIAGAIEVILEQLQAREVPVAQDAAGIQDPSDDEELTDSPDVPDRRRTRTAS
jgi:predicted PurR-regulated permease PerM